MNTRRLRNDLLDWRDRTIDRYWRERFVLLAGIVVFLLWVAGQVFAGEPSLTEPSLPPAVYSHPETTP